MNLSRSRQVARLLAVLALSGLGFGPTAVQARAEAAPSENAQAAEPDGAKDFAFLIGEWKVRHRRLKPVLKGADTWSEFDGTLVARKIWDGRGHVDEFRGNSPSGPIEGMSVRLYEPSSKQWRDYYANAAKPILEQPVVGTFKNGRGEFLSHELFEGKGIYVRQVWSNLTPTSCRWEQAFSADAGRTWETNWIMDLTR